MVGRLPSSYGCELQFVTPLDGWCPEIGAAAGSEGPKLYRTVDAGQQWRLVSVTGPAGNRPGSLPFGCDKALDLKSPTVGWAVFQCAGGTPLLRSWTSQIARSAGL